MIDPRELALAAASQASEATAELLRYIREGNQISEGPFEGDVVEQLLDAAKMAMEIEGWPDDQAERGQAYAAVAGFLQGWA